MIPRGGGGCVLRQWLYEKIGAVILKQGRHRIGKEKRS
jgi:hypothetical protein